MSATTLLLLAALAQEGAAPSYAREVGPLLVARCAGCHHAGEAEAGLDLSSHAGLLAGADGEAVLVPGDPGASLLLEIVTPFGDLAADMPPAGEGEPLDEAERGLLERWIAAGALDDTPAGVPATPPRYTRLPVVTDLAFSPDGELLAVTGRGEVLLHRTAQPGAEPAARLVGASPRLESLAFSPDGTRLAVAGGTPGLRGELQLWDVPAARLVHSIPAAGDTLHGVSWSGDGTRVAFGGPDRALRAVDAASGEQVLFQMSHEDWVLDTVWSSDDSHLISVSRDRSMKLVQVSTQQFIDNITSITPGALKGGLMAVERRPGTDELAVAGADGVPRLYRTYREKRREIGDDFNLLRAFEPLVGRVYDLDLSADGALLAAVSSHAAGGQVRLSAVADGATRWTRDLPAGQYAVALSPAGDLVAAAGFDGRVRLLDPATGEVRATFDAVPLEPAR